MKNQTPAVSVIMPVYNQKPEYLKKAIESILQQTFNNFEFIIIDDGSTNQDCIEMMAQYAKSDERIVLIKNQQNSGCIKSLNIAVTKASCKYIARMDSDDISHVDRLQKQYDYMETRPECFLVASWANLIDMDGQLIGKKETATEYDQIRKTIFKYNFFTHPTWFFRKELMDRVGNYLETAINNEDFDFLLRIAQKFNIHILPEILLDYRINLNGVTFSKNRNQEWHAIQTRLRAIQEHGYSKLNYIYLIIPIIVYFFMPLFVKKKIIFMMYSK